MQAMVLPHGPFIAGLLDLAKTLTWIFGLIAFVVWVLGAIVYEVAGQVSNTAHTVVFEHIFGIGVGAGLAVAAAAAGIRIVKMLQDHRSEGLAIFTDILPRFAITVIAITVPIDGSGHALAYLAIRTLADTADHFGVMMTSAFAGVAYTDPGAMLQTAVSSYRFDFHGGFLEGIIPFATGIVGLASSLVLYPATFLFIVPLSLLYLYVAIMWLTRSVLLAFVIALAPLFIATAVYDHKNRFFAFWWDMVIAVTMIPIVLGVGNGVLFAMGVGNPLGGGIDQLALFPAVMACVALWMMSKLMHKLAWSGFSHGGMAQMITAASAAAFAIPEVAGGGVAVGMAVNKDKMGAFLSDKPLGKAMMAVASPSFYKASMGFAAATPWIQSSLSHLPTPVDPNSGYSQLLGVDPGGTALAGSTLPADTGTPPVMWANERYDELRRGSSTSPPLSSDQAVKQMYGELLASRAAAAVPPAPAAASAPPPPPPSPFAAWVASAAAPPASPGPPPDLTGPSHRPTYTPPPDEGDDEPL